jgi:hypothetical protein
LSFPASNTSAIVSFLFFQTSTYRLKNQIGFTKAFNILKNCELVFDRKLLKLVLCGNLCL